MDRLTLLLLLKLRQDETWYGHRIPSSIALQIRSHSERRRDRAPSGGTSTRVSRQAKLPRDALPPTAPTALLTTTLPRTIAELSSVDVAIAARLAKLGMDLFLKLHPHKHTQFRIIGVNISIKFAATTTTGSRIDGTASIARFLRPPSPPWTTEERRVDESPALKMVRQFFLTSRLSYIGSWKTRFKEFMKELRVTGGAVPTSDSVLMAVLRRCKSGDGGGGGVDGGVDVHVDDADGNRGDRVDDGTAAYLHIDADCFFVSVAMLNRPDLSRSAPIAVVSGLGDTSEVCNSFWFPLRDLVECHRHYPLSTHILLFTYFWGGCSPLGGVLGQLSCPSSRSPCQHVRQRGEEALPRGGAVVGKP
jgi:hypothetical protein